MHFDLFHSLSRIDSLNPQRTDKKVYQDFFDEVCLAEQLGFTTIWLAESHFSSEVQKRHKDAVIPNYRGEVGLNADSFQLFQKIFAMTNHINVGTAIHNIVGGNGGPIASADRVCSLAFLNSLNKNPRTLNIGYAAGRFPYINAPFGIIPRNTYESENWSAFKRLIFIEAQEIFLRLCLGETVSSASLNKFSIPGVSLDYSRRWDFEELKLVPELQPDDRSHVNFVLGSHDPLARSHAFGICDPDLFNLSFTPAKQLELIHLEMEKVCALNGGRDWHRSRLPRTVLVFIDENAKVARSKASDCFDTYIEAMRGTAQLPAKEVLMERALIGRPDQIRKALLPGAPHGFDPRDRLMLWFEFNQSDSVAIRRQMSLFAGEIMKPLKLELR